MDHYSNRQRAWRFKMPGRFDVQLAEGKERGLAPRCKERLLQLRINARRFANCRVDSSTSLK